MPHVQFALCDCFRHVYIYLALKILFGTCTAVALLNIPTLYYHCIYLSLLLRLRHKRASSLMPHLLCLLTFQVTPVGTIIRKGMHGNVESYSAFWDYAKTNETPLRKDLLSRNVTDVFVCGIATDFCVGKYILLHLLYF